MSDDLNRALLDQLRDMRDHARDLGSLLGEDLPVLTLAGALVELAGVNETLAGLADRLAQLTGAEPTA